MAPQAGSTRMRWSSANFEQASTAFLSVCAQAASPEERVGVATGQDFYDNCAGYPDAPRPRLCEAYVQMGLELLAKGYTFQGEVACVPDDVEASVVATHVVKELEQDSESRAQRLGVAFVRALRPHFPCEE